MRRMSSFNPRLKQFTRCWPLGLPLVAALCERRWKRFRQLIRFVIALGSPFQQRERRHDLLQGSVEELITSSARQRETFASKKLRGVTEVADDRAHSGAYFGVRGPLRQQMFIALQFFRLHAI